MALIIAMILVIRIVLHRTELSFMKRGIIIQAEVASEEAILMLVGIIKDKEIMNG